MGGLTRTAPRPSWLARRRLYPATVLHVLTALFLTHHFHYTNVLLLLRISLHVACKQRPQKENIASLLPGPGTAQHRTAHSAAKHGTQAAGTSTSLHYLCCCAKQSRSSSSTLPASAGRPPPRLCHRRCWHKRCLRMLACPSRGVCWQRCPRVSARLQDASAYAPQAVTAPAARSNAASPSSLLFTTAWSGASALSWVW